MTRMSAPMMLSVMSDDEVASFGRDPDAGFGALRTERGLLPLTAMSVDARVSGVVAAIEVAQTFVNSLTTPIEATYMFPLPDRSAVHRFRMEVAGRVIEGVVEERGAAREQYDEAIAKGQRAAITEEERSGVFTLRVGNLMPGEAATVRLSLVGPLPVDDGEVTFRFPLVVAPRYIPGRELGGDQAGMGGAPDTDLVPDASRISPPVMLAGVPNPVRLGIRVAIDDPNVTNVASSLHAVVQARHEVPSAAPADPYRTFAAMSQVIEVHPGERLNRDFILRWRASASELRSSLTCADDADGSGGTFMLTFVPPATKDLGAKPRDVVFVLDRSGSMEGWKMVAARRATARMIDTLTSRDRFCALAFDDSVETLPSSGLVDATDRNRFRAVEQLAKVESRGGTEMAAPLMQAAKLLAGGHDDRSRVIVLVTDGQVGNEDHLLAQIGPQLRNVRVFTLGIDQAVNAGFLRRFASAGGGLCELVESEDRLDAVMAKVHRRIGTPIAAELAVQGAAGFEVANVTPSKLPDVYAGAPVTIFGRYRGRLPVGASLTVHGTSLGDPLRAVIVRDGDASPAAWLAASWARAMIRDLEDRYATAHDDNLAHEIVTLSKRYSVLSRFTAFLAIDRSETANRTGRLQQVVQPVEQPAGWEGRAVLAAAPKAMAAAFAIPSPAPMEEMEMRAEASAFDDEQAEFAKSAPLARMPAPAAPAKAKLRSSSPPGGMAPPVGGANRLRGIVPPPPMARSQGGGLRGRAAPRKDEVQAPPSDATAYLVQLGALAHELDDQARGRNDIAAIRLLRQRLTEWIEDVRSVGGHDALATAVEALVTRLSSALAGGAAKLDELRAIASELQVLASQPPSASPPRKPSRLAFWK
ncbi:MAG: VIT domain-containing protein [Kofleriaceae bacterium]